MDLHVKHKNIFKTKIFFVYVREKERKGQMHLKKQPIVLCNWIGIVAGRVV